MQSEDQFVRTGVARADQFAIRDQFDQVKQIKFDSSAQTSNTALTIKAPPISADTSLTLEGATAELSNGNSGASKTISFDLAQNQKLTLTASTTLTFTNPTAGSVYLLKLVQGGVGSFTVTWPASVKWPQATAPTLSTAVGAIDICTFYYDGTSYFGSSGLGYA